MDNRIAEDQITARRLAIVDPRGRERIVLETNPRDDHNPSISLLDVHGVERVRVYLDGGCNTGITASVEVGPTTEIHHGTLHESEEPVVTLSACREGSTVNLGTGSGTTIVLNQDEAEGPSVRIGLGPEKTIVTPAGIKEPAAS